MTDPPTAPVASVRAVLVALVLLVVGLGLQGPGAEGSAAAAGAAQRDATPAEVAALLDEAIADDGALAELRRIDSIDGRPVDMRAATAGVESQPDIRESRLDGLAVALAAGDGETVSGPHEDATAARDAATQVLDDRKYRPTELPRPLAGPLEWLADRLRPVGDAWNSFAAAVLRVADAVPGGRFLLFLAVVGVAGAAVGWLVSRRSRAAVQRVGSSDLVDLDLDPRQLEAEADDAERRGDHATSVRRRYEAGLIRLVDAGRLDLTPATTAGGAAAQVAEVAMDEATATFEEIVYGGREAGATDSERSRSLWTDLLGAGARR